MGGQRHPADGAKLIGAANRRATRTGPTPELTGPPITRLTIPGPPWPVKQNSSVMVAAGSNVGRYFSSTRGLSWTSLGSLAVGTSHGISMSADGNELMAIHGNSIYMMQNTEQSSAGNPSFLRERWSFLADSVHEFQSSAKRRSAVLERRARATDAQFQQYIYGVTLPPATTGGLFYRLAH